MSQLLDVVLALDPLALLVLGGSLLFLAGLVWILLHDLDVEHRAADDGPGVDVPPTPLPTRPDHPSHPTRPSRRRPAA